MQVSGIVEAEPVSIDHLTLPGLEFGQLAVREAQPG